MSISVFYSFEDDQYGKYRKMNQPMEQFEVGGIMLASYAASDAMAHVQEFLQWEDLAAATNCCRATRDPQTSTIYHAWAARSTLVLPPHSVVSREILSTVTKIDSVVVPHSEWLDLLLTDSLLASRLARVRRVVLQQSRFQQEAQEKPSLSVIAHTFPSVAHLSIHRLEGVHDVQELRCFRCLRFLELSADERDTVCPISATDFPHLEELKLTRIDFRTIENMGSLANLRCFKVSEFEGTVHDLSFMRLLPKLTELRLGRVTVARTAVRDLLEVAPRLVHFECQCVESIWPRETSCASVDAVDAAMLARAFTKLESLHIWYSCLQDLSSVHLIESLRELYLRFSSEVDLSPLQALVQLERLSLSSSTPLGLAPLATLPRLVSLKHDSFGEGSRSHLTRTSFRRLQVFNGLPSESLRQMKDLDSLENLTVSTIYDYGPLDLDLVTAPRLRTLQLRLCNRCDTSDSHLRFPLLRDVSIMSRKGSSQSVLNRVAGLGELGSLSLWGIPDESDLEHLPLLPKLHRLVLWRCKLTTLNGIETLHSLRELHMKFENAATLDLTPLEQLQQLQTLKLLGTFVADVTPLTRIPSLRVVAIPEDVDCRPLVIAYHAARNRSVASELREVKHKTTNCLWGRHYHAIRIEGDC